MGFSHDMPIRIKLRWILAISNVMIVVLLGSAMIHHDQAAFRDRLAWELDVINRIVASNSASMVLFEDQEFATSMLGDLGFLPMMRRAVIYRQDRSVFAAWGDSTLSFDSLALQIDQDGPVIDQGRMILAQPVIWDDERTGTLVLAYDLNEETHHARNMLFSFVVLSALAMLVSMLVSERLQLLISRPISELADAAKRVAAKQAYAVRVKGGGEDEVGQLVEAFNEMLDQVDKREQALLQASRAKGDFLANMSHELRTPLNGVIGMADLLYEAELNEEHHNLVKFIKTSADHLLSVINDILDFSKIEAGMMEVEKVPFDLRDTVEEIRSISGGLAAEKKLDLILEVDPQVPARVVGDAVRIRQILINLVGNAVKFTSVGGIQVLVKPTLSDGDRVQLKFSVTDTGVGIPQEKQRHIFGHFTQADTSTTRDYGGTGLGLAISKQLVDLMGGTIGVDSDEGRGAEFWFILPLRTASSERRTYAPPELRNGDPDDVPAAPGPVVPAAEPADIAGCRILLAEDNPINQVFARRVLEKLGVHVNVANNGLEAVDLVQAEDFDLVLMDCQMPGIDGYEATRRIRQLGGEYVDLPIVALTAFAMAKDRDACLDAGMNDYVTKPVNQTLLREAISRWAPVTTRR